MNIRKAKPTEKEVLWDIQTQAIRELGVTHYTPEQIAAWSGDLAPEENHARMVKGFEEYINDGRIFVAEDVDGSVVGFATLYAPDSAVSAVYVRPAHAGKGIGKQLMAVLDAEAHKLGLKVLHVKASLNARAFYEHEGFVLDREEIHRFRSGVEMPCLLMTKQLA